MRPSVSHFHLLSFSPTQWFELLAVTLGIAALIIFRHKIKIGIINKRSAGIRIGNVFLSDDARLRHTHIVGATGSGKTVLLEHLIYRDLSRGYGALIIDPKGDRELYLRTKKICKDIGRLSDLHLLSSTHISETSRWNPCRLGNSSELQTKWFNSGVYLEPFYAKACEFGLLQAFNQLTLSKTKISFSITDLVQTLETQASQAQDRNLHGLFLELRNFAQGEWGSILCAAEASAGELSSDEISLLNITRKSEILFVDLPTEAKGIQSSRVGRLLLQEIMLISGMRKIYPHLKTEKPFSVFIDEFDAFATENFATLLNKGRSSQFMIHLAHQTLSDLEKIGRIFMGQVLGNCNVRFIFRQDLPQDAETWAKFFGTKSTIKKTFQMDSGLSTGHSSNRESQEFRIHPDTIKEFGTGECVLSIKSERKLKKMKIPFPVEHLKTEKFPLEREPTEFVTRSGVFPKPPEKNFERSIDSLSELLVPDFKTSKKKEINRA